MSQLNSHSSDVAPGSESHDLLLSSIVSLKEQSRSACENSCVDWQLVKCVVFYGHGGKTQDASSVVDEIEHVLFDAVELDAFHYLWRLLEAMRAGCLQKARAQSKVRQQLWIDSERFCERSRTFTNAVSDLSSAIAHEIVAPIQVERGTEKVRAVCARIQIACWECQIRHMEQSLLVCEVLLGLCECEDSSKVMRFLHIGHHDKALRDLCTRIDTLGRNCDVDFSLLAMAYFADAGFRTHSSTQPERSTNHARAAHLRMDVKASIIYDWLEGNRTAVLKVFSAERVFVMANMSTISRVRTVQIVSVDQLEHYSSAGGGDLLQLPSLDCKPPLSVRAFLGQTADFYSLPMSDILAVCDVVLQLHSLNAYGNGVKKTFMHPIFVRAEHIRRIAFSTTSPSSHTTADQVCSSDCADPLTDQNRIDVCTSVLKVVGDSIRGLQDENELVCVSRDQIVQLLIAKPGSKEKRSTSMCVANAIKRVVERVHSVEWSIRAKCPDQECTLMYVAYSRPEKRRRETFESCNMANVRMYAETRAKVRDAVLVGTVEELRIFLSVIQQDSHAPPSISGRDIQDCI